MKKDKELYPPEFLHNNSAIFSLTNNFRWHRVNAGSIATLQQMSQGSDGTKEWNDIKTVIG